MNIIRMSGGIGNQMFQYALYLKLTSLGKEVKFDDVTEYELDNARPIMLSVFGIDYPKATREELVKITDASMHPLSRVRRKIFGRRSGEYHEASVDYDAAVLEKENAYLCGCFQSERYFKDIESQVRQTYQFRNILIPEEIQEKIQSYERQIKESMSVSIHIRRGDYLDAADVYGGICTDAYYNKAIRYMIERYETPHFFVFTNDTFWAEKWCEVRNRETGKEFTVITGTDEKTGYIDLMLMSRCKAHIIANSSFSWWGAWLDDSPGKCVAAPVKWLNTRECSDIYTKDMIRINAAGKMGSS
ncbi:MAG TPA: alpha-1,2-fucosyltransferase [Lachnospiraceae bacterium]|nr:alpha-1,2-fucosyltransferase [Lachnospiraceae bacterium]